VSIVFWTEPGYTILTLLYGKSAPNYNLWVSNGEGSCLYLLYLCVVYAAVVY